MGKTVLAISSQVAYGPVGNSAAVPALEAQGCTVYPIPTIILSHHPGHAQPAGLRVPASDLAAMVESLQSLGVLDGVAAVLTGYFAANDQIFGVARSIRRMKSVNPRLVYFCDPVMGVEGKGLYVPVPVAEALRDQLLPLADIASPNCFELEWLCGSPVRTAADVAEAGRRLSLPSLLAKSVPDGERLLNILCGRLGEAIVPTVRRPRAPHGTGDVLSGLFLGHLLCGRNGPSALVRALSTLSDLIEASADSPALDLSLLRRQP